MAALPQPAVAPPPAIPVALLERPEIAGWRDIFRAAPRALADEHGIRSVDAGGAVARAVSSQPRSTLLNGVVGLGVERPVTPSQLDLVAAFERAAGVDGAVALSPAANAGSLGADLLRTGRRAGTPWVKVARLPHPGAHHPTDLRVRLAGPADAGAIGCVIVDAFGLPEAFAPWFAALVGRPRGRWVVGCNGGGAVAVGGLFVHDHGAWATLGATLPAHRGRGAQGALLAARIRMAANEGVGTIVTETGAPAPGERPGPSYRNIVRAGFHEVYSRPNLRRGIGSP